MTENRRIFLNIVATYGRSLYTLVLGVFSSRWAVMALGDVDVDFGLFGVVGGLTLFVSFLAHKEQRQWQTGHAKEFCDKFGFKLIVTNFNYADVIQLSHGLTHIS